MSADMKQIVLISCSSKKLPHKARARDLYCSPLFNLSYKYATSINPDEIYILSAKHGLLDPSKEIEPYDVSLISMPAAEIREWAARVLEDLRKKSNPEKDNFIFFAGKKYRKYLTPHLEHYEVPMRGLPIGKQQEYLKKATSK